MRQVSATSFWLVIITFSAGWTSGTTQAEIRGCDASDARCLDDVFSPACMARGESWPASCEALLDELMLHPDKDAEPEILLRAGLANRMIARVAEEVSDAETRMSAAEVLYRQALAIDPNRGDAYLGLSSITDDPDEQIEWLRMATRVGPPNSLAFRLLATALARRSTPEDLVEAAGALREAYQRQTWGGHKWYLANLALSRYVHIGLEAEAREFRQSVGAEIGFESLADSLSDAERDPQASVDSLDTLCHESVVAMFGADPCISGAELLYAAALRAADVEVSHRLALVGLQRMRAAPFGSGGSFDKVPDIVIWLERLSAAGIESLELYFAMGRCYLDAGRFEDALTALQRAKSLVAFGWPRYIDEYMDIARSPQAPAARERRYCVERDTITVN
jgi:tetratricopeptide (TPR) repeat protein